MIRDVSQEHLNRHGREMNKRNGIEIETVNNMNNKSNKVGKIEK